MQLFTDMSLLVRNLLSGKDAKYVLQGKGHEARMFLLLTMAPKPATQMECFPYDGLLLLINDCSVASCTIIIWIF
jgi:hypothetical protein